LSKVLTSYLTQNRSF